MSEMNITSAQYVEINGQNNTIKIVVDGVTSSVPLAPGNKEYDEIMRQVDAGTLTIQDAD
jgi:hypothetical protein